MSALRRASIPLIVGSLGSLVFLALTAARSGHAQMPPPPPDGGAPNVLLETDTTTDITIPIDNAPPGYVLQVHRFADGSRSVALFDGTSVVSFIAQDWIVEATGTYANGYTTVCAQLAPGFALPSGMSSKCGVRADGSSSFTMATMTDTYNAFYNDICMPGGGGGIATAIFSTGAQPFAGGPPPAWGGSTPNCKSITFSKSGSSIVYTSPTADGCSCDILNGNPCPPDPCWQGPGVMVNGQCDHSHDTPSCPSPQQCSGNPDGGLCFDPTDY